MSGNKAGSASIGRVGSTTNGYNRYGNVNMTKNSYNPPVGRGPDQMKV